ncbi:hypothetical protein GQ43DRAFT_17500 [Delitschia confertaspora ATCC 74209]|uniref:BTB domain-containing protein n=1 Tax=Delitschia confertaspora ATCC 74209 TaxID=1513339 RepID=A0A9P4MTB9_9PLEO|nr:hypothetical protein GQ43DRAFT_17500 [Delitschia confertaspora ATCC 74209]
MAQYPIRTRSNEGSSPSSPPATMIPRAQKAADDPTTPVEGRNSLDRRGRDYTTMTTLTRLFAGGESNHELPNRSYNQGNGPMYLRSVSNSLSLPDHLYTRGLLEGRHSDITVIAFGQRYALHRLILDQAPFFNNALSGPWVESQSKEVTLHPEEVDSCITQQAFELTMKRLYGGDISQEADEEAVGLFATGCWLEMQDLVESSIESILRQMNPERLAPLIRLVTSNYYGRPGERILASAKSMLCRDGWEMPLNYWDGIPGDIIREIIGGDAFYVPIEWDRWVLAKRLLDRRLRRKAYEVGLIERGTRLIPKAPDSLLLTAVRFDAVYRQNTLTVSQPMPESHQMWVGLYTHPDIEPLLVLVDEGIHYTHFEYEQLEFIKNSRDVFGLPVIPEKVASNALWQQLALRQKVLNAEEEQQELGLSRTVQEPVTTTQDPPSPKGKQRAGSTAEEDDTEGIDSGSWDGNAKPRKFWIPRCDCTIVLGNGAEPAVTVSSPSHRHTTRLSATVHPEDAQWATDFASSISTMANVNTRTDHPGRPTSASGSNAGQPRPIAYTEFPPFRFSVEFPNPRVLRDRKRVYSRTVSYAGSLWNIYIQRVQSSKSVQLGVYLHRARENETDDKLTGSSLTEQNVGPVQEQIGRFSGIQNHRGRRRPNLHSWADQDDGSGSGGDPDVSRGGTARRIYGIVRPMYPIGRPGNLDEGFTLSGVPTSSARNAEMQRVLKAEPDIAAVSTYDEDDPSDSDDEDPNAAYPNPSVFLSGTSKSGAAQATLPAYIDGRPTIRTYFKIYSPSKGGRMLSVYESAPDRFNFSQSWGWKSSTLMLDEAGLGEGQEEEDEGDGEERGEMERAGEKVDGKRRGEGRLRFAVVIGNV